jgi:protein transport protein SEC31
MDDNTRKVGGLLWRLNAGEVSPGVIPKLVALCAAIDAGDWHTANHIQVSWLLEDYCGHNASEAGGVGRELR